MLDLQIKRDGNGVPLPVFKQQIKSLDIDGFIPVIINITPVINIPLLLGLLKEKNSFVSNLDSQRNNFNRSFSFNFSRDPKDYKSKS